MADRLLKQETVALWHAVQWMDVCLREWRKDDPIAVNTPAYVRQRWHLENAKKALRKVNRLRKEHP